MKFNNKIERGLLHCHTQNSLFDSSMTVKDLFNRAHELEAPAVMLSDHGTGMGFEEAKNIIEKYEGMKVIYAAEFYMLYEALNKRTHIIIAAKNLLGYQGIIKLLTKSNHNIDSAGMPLITFDNLIEFFGKDGPYHDSVLVTSACMSGIIATPLLSNFLIEKEIKKMEDKLKTLPSPYSPTFKKKKEKEESLRAKLEEITNEIAELNILAKKPYKKRLNALKKLEGDPNYEEIAEELKKEMKESENASLLIPERKAQREVVNSDLKALQKENEKSEKSHATFYKIEQSINKNRASISDEEEIYKTAKQEAEKYLNLFGDNFYMELQYHGIAEEKYVMPIVAKIAQELNIPVLAANDAHIATNSEEEIKTRQLMRGMRFNTWEELSEGDKELYIKTDIELFSMLCEILPEDIAEKAMINVEDFVSKCNVEHVKGFHYPVFKSEIEGETAEMRLRRLSLEGIERRYPGKEGWTKEHEERLNYELGVIHKLGYDDYLCIVEDFLTYGRLVGKLDPTHPDPRINEENRFDIGFLKEITNDKVGLGIGPGRGSGVGSLVNYLVGITGVDPIKYGLIFERFLNEERVSPPDIDSDVKSDIRDDVIKYIEWKYGGSDAVCGIMARSTQQARAAIRTSARLLSSKIYGDARELYDLGDKICKTIPSELGITIGKCEDDLRQAFADNSTAMTIIDNAKLIEGKFSNVTIHAAGVVIADNGDVSSYLPIMYVAGKNRFVTQADKIEVEKENLLKMDVLGLKNLRIITDTLQMVYKHTGKAIDIETVDICDLNVYKNIFAAGNTNSVFQFESPGMKNLLKRFKPEKLEHLVLLNALYRPGPMQYIDAIISVKNGETKPDYVIPEMESVLGETFGFPVYQEQLIKIFNLFAGFTLGEADIIRRAMSKKHIEEFEVYKDKFIEGLVSRGAIKEKAEKFWEELLDFSKYAFNKSHSCAYAHVAYYTAYLKYYYPREYYTAVLNTVEFEKVGSIIAECRHSNIPVHQVCVNTSNEAFSIIGNSIYYGLGSVKGVCSSARTIVEEKNLNGPFSSLSDFMCRTKADKTTVENLIYAGAFDSFSKNRTALLQIQEQYREILSKIKLQERNVLSENKAKSEKAKAKIEELMEDMRNLPINVYESENHKEKLAKEKEVTDCYLSSHPLDYYDYKSENPINILDLTPSKHTVVVGVVSNLKIVQRKRDGKKMAFFDIEDKTGTVSACIFANNYDQYGSFIAEGKILKMIGAVEEEIKENNDENKEISLKLYVKSIDDVKEKVEKICIRVRDIAEWVDKYYSIASKYRDDNGFRLIVFDEINSEFRTSKLFVSGDILNDIEITGFLTV